MARKKNQTNENAKQQPELVFLVNPTNQLRPGKLSLTTYSKEVFEKNQEIIISAGFRKATKAEIEQYYNVSLEDFEEVTEADQKEDSEQA